MNRNKKIVIISIIGILLVLFGLGAITYAYFVAGITENEGEKSIEIKAGKLEVKYTSTKTMSVPFIVPGWKSDGLHYYDSDSSDGEISAQVASSKSEIPSGINRSQGLVEPAAFTVASIGDSTHNAYYIIKLVNIQNGLQRTYPNDDRENLKVTLYRGTYDYGATENEIVYGPFQLNSNGEQIVVNNVQVIEPKVTDKYYVMLEYQNANYDQTINEGKGIQVTVQVVALGKNTKGEWVTSDGTVIDLEEEGV